MRLHGVDLELSAGEMTAVIGKNGCGKSTLLKTMAGLIRPAQGNILLDGKPLEEYGEKERARKVAYLPQSRIQPVISVEKMVLHGRFPYLSYPRRYRKEDYEAAEAAMERTGILPLRDRNMAELSGGERQKAYIAMALAQDTPVILLDEPTTFLDITYQLEVMELLKKMKQEGKAVAAVLHDIGAALQHADRIIVMEDGEVKMEAAPERIADCGILEEIFRVKVCCQRDEKGVLHYYFTQYRDGEKPV